MRPEVTKTASRFTRRSALALVLGGVGLAALPLALPRPAMAGPAPSEVMDPVTAHEKTQAGEIILVDIRTPEEWLETGIGEGAIGLDMRARDFVVALVDLRKANPDTPIALVCRTGNRSGYVVDALAQQGFPGLVDVSEGMAGGPNGKGWIPRGLPTYEGTPQNVAQKRAGLKDLGCTVC